MQDPELLQWIHCDSFQFPFARVHSVKRHFGIRRAFVILPEVMSASEDIWQR